MVLQSVDAGDSFLKCLSQKTLVYIQLHIFLMSVPVECPPKDVFVQFVPVELNVLQQA